MLEQAIKLAIEAHSGQFDKSGQPYIFHPLRVMLAVEGGIERIVAVLHDVVEDSDVFSMGDISALFGEKVSEAVLALTRCDGENYSEFIKRCAKNDIARRVKIADIKDNLRPGAPHLVERYQRALTVLENHA